MPKLLNLGCGSRFHPDWVNVDCVAADPSVLVYDLQKPLPFEDETFSAVYHSHVLEHLPRERALPFLKECHRVLKHKEGIIRVAVPDLEQQATLYLEKLRGALAGERAAQEQYEWMMVELIDQLVRQHADGGEMFKYLFRDPVPALDFVIQRLGHEVTSKLDTFQSYARNGLTPEIIDQTRAAQTPAKVGEYRTSGEAHLWMYDRYSLGKLLAAAGFKGIRVQEPGASLIPGFRLYHLDLLEDGSVRKPDSLFMEAAKY
jgi:SAM-dependent methyltransferase